jgi:alkylated DNA nucleotide flippase Atl1
MSNFNINKLTLRRFAVMLGAVLFLFTLATARYAQVHSILPDKSYQPNFAAPQERGPIITEIKEVGEDGSDIRVRYSDGDHSLEVKAKGRLEFTDDDADIKSIARDGYLMIEERRGSMLRKLEVSPNDAAQPQRTYYVGGQAHAFDQEARAWLTEILPDVIRNTAIGARARVRRIFRQRGGDGVLSEISLIKPDGAKHIYFRELLRIGNPDTSILRRAARQAAREISSDGEKANLFIETADLYLVNEAASPDFFYAIGSIHSDGEHRRVLSAILKKSPDDENILRTIKSARTISSDGEKANLLIQNSELFLNHPASLPSLFDAINSISSDGEHARVLSAMLRRNTLSEENLIRVVRSAGRISSDGEKANVLLAVIRDYAGDAGVLSAINDAAKTIGSDGERQRVLSAIARHGQ